jgi:error-prone DNA polymerase
MNGYIELCCKSAFSFLSAASAPEELAEAAAELRMEALALVDQDGLYGAPRFFRACQEVGIRPLVGADLALHDDGSVLPSRGQELVSLTSFGNKLLRISLLVKDRVGYRNLCRLITLGHSDQPKGRCRVTLAQVEEHAAGLLCLVGGLIDHALATDAAGSVTELLTRLRRGFGPQDIWVELGRHFDRAEARRSDARRAVAESVGLPIVASNDVRYALPDGRRVLDVFTCLREKVTLDRAGARLHANAEHYLKSGAAMAQLFADAPGVLQNTRRVAERCEFTLAQLGYRFPDYPVPAGETPFSFLHRLVQEGARWRYRPLTPRHAEQLAKELQLIAKLDLAGYFLVVWDICRFCRERGIMVQGRGSAANSAVCYSLGITAVDPVGMDLLFERFLSEERGQWPDIDLDLPSGDPREEVIQYVYRRYGAHGAAMTANVITYQERLAVREVGKVLGLPEPRLARMLALSGRHGSLAEGAAAAGLDSASPRVQQLLELCAAIVDLPRHLGQHSGGMVLAAGRLDDVVPLEPASMPGRSVVQWNKDDCADLGLIKVDLLGLGMLNLLTQAVPLVVAHEGVNLDLAHLPADDPKVYAMLRRADTVGVFQVESRAQMNTLPRLRPRCFYDLVVEVALIRPGPIGGKMVHPYLQRRAGREPVRYTHPCLEPILARTLGVPIFQEQVMRMAMAAAGFNVAQVEELRRAMKWRTSRRYQRHEQALRAGLSEHGIEGAAADEIVEQIVSFLGKYGFPESHAASFALLVYASAYLKAHHPAAFTCALLNAWPLGFYHPATIVKDAQRHGQAMRPLDVAHSGWLCRIDPDRAVRLGLRFVAGLRRQAGERIEEEQRRRPFRDLAEFQRRCRLRENERMTLAELGAFGSFGLRRREALWQAAAFDDSGRGLLQRLPPPADRCPLPEMSAAERTAADYQHATLTVGPHPLAHLRSQLRRQGVLPAAALTQQADGSRVRVAGVVITRQRPPTAKGMCFLTLEDESGLCNVVINPALFESQRALIVTAMGLLVEGRLQRRDGVTNLRAESFHELREPVPAPRSHDFK